MKTNLKPIALGLLLAVICANAQSPPRLEPLTFEANRPRVSLLGSAGSNYVIEASKNLNNWTVVYSGMATNGHLAFVHADASNSVKQFYRAYAGNPPAPPIRFVIPRPDTNKTVSTLVTPAGGSCDLYLEGAARVTLTFPSNTVADARYVTMTLITNVVGLPFGRGILGAVRIEPDDLNIIGAAALEFTFNTGSNFDRRQIASFACNGDGFDFRLTPDRVRTNSANLRLTRAGVFGSCLATAQELTPFAAFSAASAKPEFSPASASLADASDDGAGYDYLNASVLCFPERIAAAEAIQELLQSDIDAISERIGVSLAQARQAQLTGATDDSFPVDEIGLEACTFYHDRIRPLFAQVENNCSLLKVLAGATLGIARQVQLMGYTSCPELLSLDGLPICSGARACLDEIKQCCQRMPEQRDRFRIDLVSAIRQQALLGAGCFDFGDADMERILEGCSDLTWNGSVRITETGEVQESDAHFVRVRVLSRVFEGVVTDAFEIGDSSAILTVTGDLAYSDKTTSINRMVCPGIGGKNCGDEADVNESSAVGKQQVTVILGWSGTGSNLTYTIYIGNGMISAPTKEDHHGYAVQNCNTCQKADFSSVSESPGGGAVPTLLNYQASLSSSNSVQGSTQMEEQFDALGPSEITFKWDLSRRPQP